MHYYRLALGEWMREQAFCHTQVAATHGRRRAYWMEAHRQAGLAIAALQGKLFGA